MLRVTCHMSLTATATATDPPPSPDPGFFFVIAYLDLVPLLVGVIRREKKRKKKVVQHLMDIATYKQNQPRGQFGENHIISPI